MEPERRFRCLLVERDPSGATTMRVADRPQSDLPPGEVTVAVAWSSLNYKDALAATGHPGIVRRLPHIPGIDAAGTVVESTHPDWRVGQEVLVTGYELGAGRWGGWAERIRVPASWVVALPEGLAPRQAMILGTAGFTAAQGVGELERNQVEPASGPCIVTGATGGVGCLAVQILARLGYEVTAASRKLESHGWLESLGARHALHPNQLLIPPDRPLGTARWAGGIDTVGGPILASLLRTTHVGGCIAACGLTAGTDLNLTVYPFILRGTKLAGITSAQAPAALRPIIWNDLATCWRPPKLEELATEITLEDLPGAVAEMLEGRRRGRTLVRIA